MNRKNRRRVNQLANVVEDASQWLVGWLRSKAARKYRPRPLVFPNALWLGLMEANDRMLREQARKFIADLQVYDDNRPHNIRARPDVAIGHMNRIQVPGDSA